MEMTLARLGIKNTKGILGSSVMPLGILALVAMMVLPLPVFLLDTFFVSNILVSLLILMVASSFILSKLRPRYAKVFKFHWL